MRDGRTIDLRPPLRIDASYAVTAWTRDVQDEHRLLSQAMAILYAFPTLPEDVLSASLANGSQRYPLKTTTAQERHEDASDFWSAVGGQYKASFNYVVTLSCEPGVSLERGPEVRTATTRLFDRDARAATLLEMHRAAAQSSTPTARASATSGCTCSETGQLAVTDAEGRFRFDRLRPAATPSRPAAPTARRTKAQARRFPGQGAELTLGAAKAAAKQHVTALAMRCPTGAGRLPQSVPRPLLAGVERGNPEFRVCPDGL